MAEERDAMQHAPGKSSASRVGWHIIWTIGTLHAVCIGFILLNMQFGWIDRSSSAAPGLQLGILAAVLVLAARIHSARLHQRIR